jgi:hypothetical protein
VEEVIHLALNGTELQVPDPDTASLYDNEMVRDLARMSIKKSAKEVNVHCRSCIFQADDSSTRPSLVKNEISKVLVNGNKYPVLIVGQGEDCVI